MHNLKVKNLKKSHKGFTMMELGLVILVMTVLALGFTASKNIIRNGKLVVMKMEADNVFKQTRLFESDFEALPGALTEAQYNRISDRFTTKVTDKTNWFRDSESRTIYTAADAVKHMKVLARTGYMGSVPGADSDAISGPTVYPNSADSIFATSLPKSKINDAVIWFANLQDANDNIHLKLVAPESAYKKRIVGFARYLPSASASSETALDSFSSEPVVTANFMNALDKKFDDGNALTGSIVAGNISAGDVACHVSGTYNSSETLSSALGCMPVFVE